MKLLQGGSSHTHVSIFCFCFLWSMQFPARHPEMETVGHLKLKVQPHSGAVLDFNCSTLQHIVWKDNAKKLLTSCGWLPKQVVWWLGNFTVALMSASPLHDTCDTVCTSVSRRLSIKLDETGRRHWHVMCAGQSRCSAVSLTGQIYFFYLDNILITHNTLVVCIFHQIRFTAFCFKCGH